MKKYLSYILIVLTLVGIFSPTVQAETLGTCVNVPFPTTTTTRENCPAPGRWTFNPEATANANKPNTNDSSDPTKPCEYAPGDTTLSNPINEPCEYYHLLAPLPGIKDDLVPTGKGALGSYLNTMLRIFIGICAVLAMVMIVLGGLEYMTSELISSKENGKHKITGAIFGLIIALGSYALLNTINPDLLNTDVNIEGVKIQIALKEAIPSDTGNPPGATAGCSAGVIKTTINMFACGDIVQNVNNMLADAKNAGLNITGGGYRSIEQQKQLRIEHCNGDYTNSNASCIPPTALPGQSNHNNGKAFDLRCDGEFIQTSDNKCFIWLKNNASKYGLYNLPSEPWHWSVDGH